MVPSKKVSTRGKGAQTTVSKVRTPRISVMAEEKNRTADGPSRTEISVRDDGLPSNWLRNEAAFLSFGWMNFLSLPRNHCEKVVKHFYANAELVEPTAEYLETVVKGVAFEVDDKLISRLYGIPTGGEFYNGTFNRLEACRVIFKNEAMVQTSRDVSLLDRDMRLLHLIIVHVLKPRARKLSSLTNEDTWMMWKIALGQRIDLCDLVVSEMVGCRNKPELRLFYGRLITDIAVKLGADLKKEKFSFMHSNTKIGASSLARARFELVDGAWVKPGVEVEDEEVGGAAQPPSSSPAD
ncbi:Uncharacterized protein Adt_28658 [Abeliophyllum distichum]|uniref:Putative plant transposon protein domain-containing protein n=1 Tax=Abeliophyllum distichum TaxID=126358 RepID=A0ABD1RX77_9LAMI